jgi:hypothetical protein
MEDIGIPLTPCHKFLLKMAVSAINDSPNAKLRELFKNQSGDMTNLAFMIANEIITNIEELLAGDASALLRWQNIPDSVILVAKGLYVFARSKSFSPKTIIRAFLERIPEDIVLDVKFTEVFAPQSRAKERGHACKAAAPRQSAGGKARRPRRK